MLKWCGFGSKKSAEDAAPAAAAAPSVAGRGYHSAGSPSRASVRVSDALEAVRAPLPSSQPSDAVVEERFLELLRELGLPPAARTAMLAQSVEQKWRMVCARQEDVASGSEDRHATSVYLERLRALPRSSPAAREETLRSLTEQLRSCPLTWLTEFVQRGGLDAMASALRSFRDAPPTFLRLLEALQNAIKVDEMLDWISEHEALVGALVAGLASPDVRQRQLVLLLLVVIAGEDEEGLFNVLGALDAFAREADEPVPFAHLVGALREGLDHAFVPSEEDGLVFGGRNPWEAAAAATTSSTSRADGARAKDAVAELERLRVEVKDSLVARWRLRSAGLLFIATLLRRTGSIESRMELRGALAWAGLLEALSAVREAAAEILSSAEDLRVEGSAPPSPAHASLWQACEECIRFSESILQASAEDDAFALRTTGVLLADPNVVFSAVLSSAAEYNHTGALLGVLHGLLAIPSSSEALGAVTWTRVLRAIRGVVLGEDAAAAATAAAESDGGDGGDGGDAPSRISVEELSVLLSLQDENQRLRTHSSAPASAVSTASSAPAASSSTSASRLVTGDALAPGGGGVPRESVLTPRSRHQRQVSAQMMEQVATAAASARLAELEGEARIAERVQLRSATLEAELSDVRATLARVAAERAELEARLAAATATPETDRHTPGSRVALLEDEVARLRDELAQARQLAALALAAPAPSAAVPTPLAAPAPTGPRGPPRPNPTPSATTNPGAAAPHPAGPGGLLPRPRPPSAAPTPPPTTAASDAANLGPSPARPRPPRGTASTSASEPAASSPSPAQSARPTARPLRGAPSGAPPSPSAASVEAGPSASAVTSGARPPRGARPVATGAGTTTTAAAAPSAAVSAAPAAPPKKPVIKPAAKMRGIFWTKIPDAVAVHQTRWRDWGVEDDPVDVAALVERFGAGDAALRSEGDSSGSSNDGGASTVSRAPILLLDAKRNQNAGIALARLRLSPDTAMRALLDVENLTADQVQMLQTLTPTAEERSAIADFEGPVERLGPVERHMRALLALPRLAERLGSIRFMVDFGAPVAPSSEAGSGALPLSSPMREAWTKIGVVESALRSIDTCEPLRKLLRLVLSIGNYLNGGTARGGAYGVRLDVLDRLKTVKAVDGKSTLLDFIVALSLDEKARNPSQPAVVDLPEALVASDAAKEIDVGELESELGRLDEGVRMLEAEADFATGLDGDRFPSVARSFAHEARRQLAHVRDRVNALKALFRTVADSFGEEGQDDIKGFVTLFANFKDEMRRQREAEVARRARRAQQERAALAAPRGGPKLGAAASVGGGAGAGESSGGILAAVIAAATARQAARARAAETDASATFFEQRLRRQEDQVDALSTSRDPAVPRPGARTGASMRTLRFGTLRKKSVRTVLEG